jgi:transposase
VIRREFGVSYHPSHVSRLLKALRQSLQKPKRRAFQRNEEAIDRFFAVFGATEAPAESW